MSELLLNSLLSIGVFAGVVFSFRVGAWPEKSGAVAIGVGVVLTQAAQLLAGSPPLVLFFVFDVVLGGVLLAITVKSGRLWAGVAACAQSLVIVFTAVRYFHFPLDGKTYLVALNIASWMVHLSLWVGAAVHRYRPDPDADGELAFVS